MMVSPSSERRLPLTQTINRVLEMFNEAQSEVADRDGPQGVFALNVAVAGAAFNAARLAAGVVRQDLNDENIRRVVGEACSAAADMCERQLEERL